MEKAQKAKKVLFRAYSAFDRSKLLNSIRKGFIMLIPIFTVGGFALMLMNVPIPAVKNWIESVWGGAIFNVFTFVYEATFGLMAVYILLAVSYRYSQEIFGESDTLNILAAIVSVASYFALLGTKHAVGGDSALKMVVLKYLDVQSVFPALLTAVLSTRLFTCLCRLVNRIKRVTPGIEIDFKRAMSAISPLAATVLVFAICGLLIEVIFHAENLNELIISAFTKPFQNLGRNIWSALLMTLSQTVLWFFGVHGGNALDTVNLDIFSNLPGEILTKRFLDTFVLLGGCGAAICLFLALLFFSKSKSHRLLTRSCAFPIAFNINEILIFGLPVVLNPVMLVPFLLTPVVTLLTSYGALSLGLVPLTSEAVQWTTPLFFSGYLATNSFAGVLLQIFNIALGTLIYMPFVKLANRLERLRFEENLDCLTETVKTAERAGTAPVLLSGEKRLAASARELALAMRDAVDKKEITLYYQPEVNEQGKVSGCEALLRWKYLSERFIYPPLLIALAKEDNFLEKLTEYILLTALDAAKECNARLGEGTTLYVNLRAGQVGNPAFARDIVRAKEERGILSGTFGIEITEETELGEDENVRESFDILHRNGILIAIDDFSMGATSLKYLQNNAFDLVKLDGKLVRDVENQRSRKIIESITGLGARLGFGILAECVETEKQRNLLLRLGCRNFQGWLYSPALPLADFFRYALPESSEEE